MPSLFAKISGTVGWFAVGGMSLVLGVVLGQSSLLATAHQGVVLLAVISVGVVARRPDWPLALTLYAGSCDVLWRSAGARGPWEGAKYALIAGFVIFSVRFLQRPRNLSLTLLLLGALVPGVLVGLAALGLSSGRENAAAGLSGIVALALGVLVFTNVRVTAGEARGMYLVALAPAISVGAIASVATLTAEDLDFGTQSNFVTAGGFGPVQVSALLSFGGLLCTLVVLQRAAPLRLRLVALVTGVWMLGQALLTFSRGGVFSYAVAAAALVLASMAVAHQRTRVLIAAGILMVVALQVLSWAGAFTGGASEERFSSTDSTNRVELAEADLELFYENPVLGVGVGVSNFERDFAVRAAPHTEYSRLLADHGLLGLGVLVLLVWISVGIIRNAGGWFRIAAVGLLALSYAQMTHSATRIGCIALGFALAGLREQTE